jgi:DNA-binding transcriptional regulator YdaS (Cro superfamily)
MLRTEKANKRTERRGERHSAAWGKRLTAALLVLVAEAAFAQTTTGGRPKFAPDLASKVERARQGVARTNEYVDVIVQYRQAPQSEQEGRVQRMGARLNHRLGMSRACL